MANILSIGKSALTAAQVAIDVTGQNIANASTVGYSRQTVIQEAVAGQYSGFGYIGKGTEIVAVRRVYSEYLGTQVRTAQTSKGQLDSYYAQIQQIDNLLADPTVGVSPALQDFFNGLQDLSSAPSSAVARQSLLSTAESLVSRFQGMNQQLSEMQQGVNSQIKATVTSVNAYAKQIAALNDAIEKAQGRIDSSPPNELLDQRDQLLLDLGKEIQVSIVKQGSSYDVYIGNGIPLVIGAQTYAMTTVSSPTDPSRMEVAYQSSGVTTILSDSVLSGGSLAGLLQFRNETLDVAQNSLGRIATVLATTLNEQHRLGQDLNGNAGGNFFSLTAPVVTADSRNLSSTAVTAAIGDSKLLTTSDYRLSYNGSNYTLLRLSDGVALSNTDLAAAETAAASQGFTINVSAPPSSGDSFLIRPTANGASGIRLAIADISLIAAAAPMLGSAATTNLGTGKISAGTVNSPPPQNINLQQPVTITFNANGTYNVVGTGTGNPSNLAFTAGGDITYNGWTVQISGSPASGDTFTIGPNTSGNGDNRNALLLGGLQTTGLIGGTTTYQGAYSQLVNMIGNKTSELSVTSAAAGKLYKNAYKAQQAESGVNLDEEAANLLRYQQSYQAAAKVMKTANDLFELLLSL